MARKKKRAQKQKRKNYDDTENASQSEPTNLNNVPDSWECPTSARRNLTENPKEVSTRLRRSLRLAAKPIQNGITSLSRGHSSAPDEIQQDDDPPETTDSECQGLGKDSDKKESPSRYLVSFIPPPTLELIPFEQENLEVETTNNQRKCVLWDGCSSQSYNSSKLSEMVAMMGNENGDDEVDSEIPSQAGDFVNGYHVKVEFMPILRQIIDKHGDIARNCVTESAKHRSELLEMICGIILDFENKEVGSIKESSLIDKIALVDGMSKMKMEVDWLHKRLSEVHEAKEILMMSSDLKAKVAKNRKLVEQYEIKLQECEVQKKELNEKLERVCEKEILCKENLARAMEESVTTSRIVKFAISKVGSFLNCSLFDALI